MGGRRVELRHLDVTDVRAVYELATRPASIGRWRLAGAPLTIDEFADFLWSSADVQMCMLRRGTSGVIGLVQAYAMDLRSRHASLSVLVDDRLWGAGWPTEGVVRFIDHLFEQFALRKLYVHLPECNLASLRNVAKRWLVEEGVLRDRQLLMGDHQDVRVLSLWRRDWDPELAARITGRTTKGGCGRPGREHQVGSGPGGAGT